MSSIKGLIVDQTGDPKGELVGANFPEVTWELNAPGTAQLTIDPLAPAAKRILLNKIEIQIWINDILRWWGVPRRATGDSRQMTFVLEGLLSHLDYRYITNATQTFGVAGTPGDPAADPPVLPTDAIPVEQFTIAWGLINYAQTGANMDRNFRPAAWVASGVQRFREYKREEHANILELLGEFPGLKRGFDFEIKPYGDGRRVFTPYYPRKGIYRPTMVMEWGRNVADFQYDEDGTRQATEVYATGGSNGDIKFEENYEDVALSAEFGVMQRIISDGNQKDVGWLQDMAEQEVVDFGRPLVLPTLTVNNHPVQLDGVLEVGDTVPVRVDHGRCYMMGDFRISKITRKGEESLDLNFVEP